MSYPKTCCDEQALVLFKVKPDGLNGEHESKFQDIYKALDRLSRTARESAVGVVAASIVIVADKRYRA